MKDLLKTIIGGIIFFGVYSLLEFLFEKNINWLLTVVATIVFIILETIGNLYTKRK